MEMEGPRHGLVPASEEQRLAGAWTDHVGHHQIVRLVV